MKVRVQDEEVSFNLFEATKHSKDKGVCFKMNAFDEAIIYVWKQEHTPNLLEQALNVINAKGAKEIGECLKECKKFKKNPVLNDKTKELKNKPKQFSKQFTKEFSKITKSLSNLLNKMTLCGEIELEEQALKDDWTIKEQRLK